MSTITLAQSAVLAQDELIAGVIATIVEVNEMFDMFPFQGIDGNALAYNREETLGKVAFVGVGDTDGVIGPDASSGSNQAARAAAKDPATFVQVTSSLTTLMGDAEVNGLIQATRSDDNDQTMLQIASKAKSLGRQYQDTMINGDGTALSFPGLLSLMPVSQTVSTGTDGDDLAFEQLDDLMGLIKDKEGQIDYFMAHNKAINKYRALLRALGGASINEVYNLPSGRTVKNVYSGIPIFRNDWIPVNRTTGATAGTTTVWFAGTFDDGSMTHGVAGLTARNQAGIKVIDVGESHTKDEHIHRLRWYCGLANFSQLGLAMIDGIHTV